VKVQGDRKPHQRSGAGDDLHAIARQRQHERERANVARRAAQLAAAEEWVRRYGNDGQGGTGGGKGGAQS
jgi:hypothetical protein